MKTLFWWIPMMGLAIMSTGCATPQAIDITSEPSKAAVSVNNEYIGKTPIVHNVKNVKKHDSLVIIVEKLGYESDMRRVEKKGGGLIKVGKFPKKLHFVLQPTQFLPKNRERR